MYCMGKNVFNSTALSRMRYKSTSYTLSLPSVASNSLDKHLQSYNIFINSIISDEIYMMTT